MTSLPFICVENCVWVITSDSMSLLTVNVYSACEKYPWPNIQRSFSCSSVGRRRQMWTVWARCFPTSWHLSPLLESQWQRKETLRERWGFKSRLLPFQSMSCSFIYEPSGFIKTGWCQFIQSLLRHMFLNLYRINLNCFPSLINLPHLMYSESSRLSELHKE